MEVNKVIEILNRLIIDDERLSTDERDAIGESLKTVLQYERKQEEQIDFQGWSLQECTMKNLREFMKKNKNLDGDTRILLLEDDGMGYGARNGYCTEISVGEDKDNKKEVHIWY